MLKEGIIRIQMNACSPNTKSNSGFSGMMCARKTSETEGGVGNAFFASASYSSKVCLVGGYAFLSKMSCCRNNQKSLLRGAHTLSINGTGRDTPTWTNRYLPCYIIIAVRGILLTSVE